MVPFRVLIPLFIQVIEVGHPDVRPDSVEAIVPYALAPWDARLRSLIITDMDRANEVPQQVGEVHICTSSLARKGKGGMRGAVQDGWRNQPYDRSHEYFCTLGPRAEQNTYVAEPAAVAEGLAPLGPPVQNLDIRIFTRNRAATQAISQPKSQSGQQIIRQICVEVERLWRRNNRIALIRIPATAENIFAQQARVAALASTERGRATTGHLLAAKSTILSAWKTNVKTMRQFVSDVGRFTLQLDTALPRPHTRAIYDSLGRNGANVLAQLRTRLARLNGYLLRIGATENEKCACRHEKETVEHFLFRCRKWDFNRMEMLELTEINRSNPSFYLAARH